MYHSVTSLSTLISNTVKPNSKTYSRGKAQLFGSFIQASRTRKQESARSEFYDINIMNSHNCIGDIIIDCFMRDDNTEGIRKPFFSLLNCPPNIFLDSCFKNIPDVSFSEDNNMNSLSSPI